MPTDAERAKFNAFVVRQIFKASTLAEKLYWRSLFV